MSHGWIELVDRCRDLGASLPGGTTRREEAVLLAGFGVKPMADAADGYVFGGGDVDPAAVETYWSQVDRHRREMASLLGRRQRVKAALSIRRCYPVGRSDDNLRRRGPREDQALAAAAQWP